MRRAVPFMQCLLLLLALSIPLAEAAADPVQNRKSPFIRATVTGTGRPYVGEEQLLTYTLYFIGDAPQVSDESNPSLDGLWHSEIDPGRFVKSRPVTLDNAVYRSAVIRQYKFAPLRAGRFGVGGYRLKCLFTGNAGSSVTRTMLISAPSVVIDAKALPEPIPEGFSGAVGTFSSFEQSAEHTTRRTGEPVTLALTVRGKGNLQTLRIPEPAVPSAVHKRAPVTVLSLDSSSAFSAGSLTSRVTVYPQQPGKTVIPPLRFVYFDPEKKQYRTLSSRPLAIEAGQGEKSGTMDSLNFPRPDAAGPENAGQAQLKTAGKAVAAVLAAVLIVALVMKRFGKHPERTDKKSAAIADESPSPENLKAQMYSLIEEKTGIRKPESLTRAQLSTALAAKNIPPTTSRQIERVLETIDRMLYSPAGATENEMILLGSEGKRLLQILRQL